MIAQLNATENGWATNVASVIHGTGLTLVIENVKLSASPVAIASFVQTAASFATWLQFNQYHESVLHVSGATTSKILSVFNAPLLEQVIMQPNEHIRELYIYKTGVAYLPRGLRHIRNLENVQVCSSSLTQFTLASLSPSQRIGIVDLSENMINALVGAAHTVYIEMLEMSENQLSVLDMAFFRQIPNLTHLNVEGNRLTRIECSQPVTFTALTQLLLAENQLQSFQTSGMQFPALLNLVLANNNLTQIPRNLGRYPALERLDLNRNKIALVDLSSIRQARNLTILSLQANRIKSFGTSTPVSHNNLWAILLNRNELEQVDFVGCNFPKLSTLSLQGNKFAMIPPNIFSQFPAIRVNMEGNALRSSPRAVASFVQVLSGLTKSLSLSLYRERVLFISHKNEAERIEVRDAPELQELQVQPNDHIRTLHIYNASLIHLPQGLKDFPKLEDLYVSNNHLTQLALASFSSIQKLSRVDVSVNRISLLLATNQTISIKSLHMDKNRLTVVNMEFFAHIVNLNNLYLGENQIIRIDNTKPLKMSTLGTLSLGSNHLSSFQPLLTEFPALRSLFLHDNKLATIPRNLGKYPLLEILDLRANRLTRVDLASIRQASKLRQLHLNKNNIALVSASTPLKHETLRIVEMEGNKLGRIDLTGCDFPKLEQLNLGSNKLTSVPPNIFQQSPSVSLLMWGNAMRCDDLVKYQQQLADYKLIVDPFWQDKRCLRNAVEQKSSTVIIEKATISAAQGAMESFVQVVARFTVHLEFEKYYERLFYIPEANVAETIIISYAPELEELKIQPNGQLRELSVYNTVLNRLPQGLRSLPHLVSLNAPANQLTQFTLASFSSTQKLAYVNVSANKISLLLGANHTVSIRSLWINQNRLTTLDVSFFEQIVGLSSIYVEENWITRIESTKPVKLPVLEKLYLSNNELSSFQPHAAEFPALTVLNLDGNKLTVVPRNLVNYPWLRTLELRSNQLTRLDLSSLRQARNLSYLSLEGNKIASVTATTPLKLDALSQILLDENELTQVSVAGCNFPNLRGFSLRWNRLNSVPQNVFQQFPEVALYMWGNTLRCDDLAKYRTELLAYKLVIDSVESRTQCPEQTFVEIAEKTLVCCSN
uniref:Uncharacterized protein n=1 Tax=Anopheles atroparvus TaxID=41427 RepID=A0A182J330_ANOAO